MSTKTFKVVKPLSVRETASLNAARVGDGFQPGTVITVQANTRTEADGFVWWQHDQGWSAERKADGSAVLMEEVAQATAAATPATTPAPATTTSTPSDVTYFYISKFVRVRMSAGLNGTPVPDVMLQPDTTIETVPGSRTELDGFIWWQHDRGWSASQSTDGSQTFMEQIDSPHQPPPSYFASLDAQGNPPAAEETTDDDQPAAAVKVGRTATVNREFKVSISVKIRKSPGLGGEELEERLEPGVVVNVDPDSRTEADGFIWWKHDKGWSAGSNLDGSTVFFTDPNAPDPGSKEAQGTADGVSATDGSISVDALPQRDGLFSRLPVDFNLTAWVQYFGNTNFAFKNGARWGYPAYAQGLHSGFDFGNATANYNPAIPCYAGVSGTFVRNNQYGVAVQSGEYLVIYQHLVNTDSYVKGGQVTPDTQIGILDPSFGSNRHLHLEVRYKGERYIINPLLMMPANMRDMLLNRFTNFDMSSANGWSKWLTPMDQPIIVLGGPVIGPTA